MKGELFVPNNFNHEPNDFTPVVGAMGLADHVINITDNFNKFPDYIETKRENMDGTATTIYIQRQDSLTNWVREQAKEIYISNWCANEINVKKEPHRKEERLALQQKAIRLCNEHLAAMQLCKKHFGLSNKKVNYWGKKTIEVREATKKWNDSDMIRYK